jgi:CheY-like chemotaxis protein
VAEAPDIEKASPKASSVLVVGDEEPVRKFVERVLRDAGYRTAMAGDGPGSFETPRELNAK